MTNKERYDYRRANGLCVDCGKPAIEGKARCLVCDKKASANCETYRKEHREERRLKKRELYKYRIEHGLCGECGKPNSNGKAKCDECLQKANERSKRRRGYLKSIGRCPQCGAKVAPGWVYCPVCRLKNVEYEENADDETKERRRNSRKKSDASRRERYGNEGRCKKCGREKEDDGYLSCEFCRAKAISRYVENHTPSMKKENGICLWCDKPAVDGHCYCEEHLKQHREAAAYARTFSKKDLIKKYMDVNVAEAKWRKANE